MGWEILGVLVLVVAVIVGPFASLRAVSRYRLRMSAAAKRRQAEMEARDRAEDAADRPHGFW